MDTFPASQPIPVQEPSQKSLRKVFNVSSWIILFALAPLTVLIFLSQDSIPGDFFYPVKRGMENVILAAASVNPVTRAAFRTDLTQVRFKEAQSLVVSKSNTSGLSTFIDEVQGAQLEVASLKNDTEREKAEEKLINKLEEYQAGLSTLEAKTEQNIITYQFQETPSSPPIRTPTPVKQASSASPEASAPTSTPTPLSSFKSQPTSTLTPVPTLTLSPTIEPTAAPQPENTQVTKQKKISQTLKETREQLNNIRKDLEEKRKEERKVEKHEERNEDDKKDSDRHKSDD